MGPLEEGSKETGHMSKKYEQNHYMIIIRLHGRDYWHLHSAIIRGIGTK